MHMQNPHIPAMHFNTRFICTTKNWFGGGMDVTPAIKDEKERKNFHKILKAMCDSCLLYTSPSPRDATLSRMPSSA